MALGAQYTVTKVENTASSEEIEAAKQARLKDLRSASATSALTLQPQLKVTCGASATEDELRALFMAEFPTCVLRMAKEDAEAEDHEGYGILDFLSADQAKLCLATFDGCRLRDGTALQLEISSTAKTGSLATRGRGKNANGLLHHDRKLLQLRRVERDRGDRERSEYASLVPSSVRGADGAAPEAAAVGSSRPKAKFSVGALPKKKPKLGESVAGAAPAMAGLCNYASESESESEEEELPHKAAAATPASETKGIAFTKSARYSSSKSGEGEPAQGGTPAEGGTPAAGITDAAAEKIEAEEAAPEKTVQQLAAEALKARLSGNTALYEEKMALVKAMRENF